LGPYGDHLGAIFEHLGAIFRKFPSANAEDAGLPESERAKVYELVAGIQDRNIRIMQQIHICIADPLLALGALKGNVNHVLLWCCSYVDIRTMGVCCLKPFEGGRPLWEARDRHVGPSWSHLGAILGLFRGVLEPSWGHLGASWGHRGPSWGYLGPS
jgi:hypothetical protein